MKVGFMLQNFLFTSKDENSTLKAIDFGLSDYVKPGQTYCQLCTYSLIFLTEYKTIKANNKEFLQMRG